MNVKSFYGNSNSAGGKLLSRRLERAENRVRSAILDPSSSSILDEDSLKVFSSQNLALQRAEAENEKAEAEKFGVFAFEIDANSGKRNFICCKPKI